MTKSIKQIDKNLKALNIQVQDLAKILEGLNRDYLRYLITVVKKQLMVASYQICTQKYPESFLNLSYSQRTKLQEKIKDLAGNFSKKLTEDWQKIDDLSDNPIVQQLHQNILTIVSSSEKKQNLTQTITSADGSNDIQPTAEEENVTSPVNFAQDDIDELQPEYLIELQIEFDNCLEQGLIDLSNSVNQSLQEAEIISNKIPNQILAIALQAEDNTSIVSGSPNLVSILIEKDTPSEQEQIDITPVIAVCLRINDSEFHDPKLNLLKQKINKVLAQLNSFAQRYQELQQKYTIAQAESAWRTSWYEEE